MALAVPARPFPFAATQPDGSELMLTLIGDERFHYYVTEDGVTVLQECIGPKVSYFYATVKDGVMVPSNVLAHSKGKRSIEERRFVKSQSEVVAKCIASRSDRNRVAISPQTKVKSSPNVPCLGKKKGLVILVNFSDLAMVGLNPKEVFNRQFNEVGYSDNGHIGSVRDYFYDQSFGQFELIFDVVGPVTVSRECSYYGKNDNVIGNTDLHVGRMVAEACILADDEIDYSDYDWNGDGAVEQVYIIYAGYGESSGAPAYTIWPHQYSLSHCMISGDGDGALFLDGVRVDKYACSCELSGISGNTIDGIGTSCHEFSHCLGLPDLYDVDYSGGFGMDKWDIMSSGSHSGPQGYGEVPYGYSAYERAYLGWMELTELDDDAKCKLPPLNNNGFAYRITNHGNMDEFFVLENHQSSGWYSYFGDNKAPHGMMITHIDYDNKAWNNNTVNTLPSHMRASLVPADKDYGTFISSSNRYHLTEEEFSGDLFPGSSNATRFSSETYEECGGKLFNMNIDDSYYLGMNLENITEDYGIISFTIGKSLNVPINIMATQTGDRLRIQWDEVENAVEYSAEIIKIKKLVPISIESEKIDGIRNTCIDIDNIDCRHVNIRLKASNAYVTSEWSEFVNIRTDTDGIVTPQVGDDYYHRLYTIDGLRVEIPQGKGIYIHIENNRKRKIYISK